MSWPFSSCIRSLKASVSAGVRAQWTSCARQFGPTCQVSTLPSAAQLHGQEQVMKTSVVTANTKEIKDTSPSDCSLCSLRNILSSLGSTCKISPSLWNKLWISLSEPSLPLSSPSPSPAGCPMHSLLPTFPLDVCQHAYEIAQHTNLEQV